MTPTEPTATNPPEEPESRTLIVKKVVNNDNGGNKVASDFSFQVSGGGAIRFESDGENELSVSEGPYSVTEVEADGYTASYNNCSNITISAGDSVTCTITNDDNAVAQEEAAQEEAPEVAAQLPPPVPTAPPATPTPVPTAEPTVEPTEIPVVLAGPPPSIPQAPVPQRLPSAGNGDDLGGTSSAIWMMIGLTMAGAGYVMRRRLEPALVEATSGDERRTTAGSGRGNVVAMLAMAGVLFAAASYFKRRRP